ncbi:Na(+)-translocating NADH-quinone reductase subunit C [Halomonas sp. McH1-25]|uniref:Na(+)-translocating NADH-quinone reductase subunit C n=1 Tax=unclassified Halomonas TaxID=2609666 RepID=UPI001EF55F63|nr:MULTISPECIES: Na(+)-translocating NADH-quinone reductase subunit C [unclassified Halomonas]MCG7599060.1 Na(+)-translocating NADH-quinone reductase subunit C [Halomonas sp. McH1-25]MCP1342383.1 Na(+)-translocating NADH-quinone reductase subunit C [Halomonas sp. FL8]MCP1363069.1 Na(+)-translocating NADH-quinone reductase subunit C [Halomonas sp. BBD45]MCP1364042.1 Na(+)-translocating NADH-quinone reductase subunit C [Halomonas sp. BBD48]
MMASNNSIKKTLTVALTLCIVCSVIVSTAAVVLRPVQVANQELDRRSNILQVAQLYQPGIDVAEQFEQQITARVVNLETGEYAEELDAETYNQFDAAKDPASSRSLSGDDPVGLGRVENFATVYLVGDPENPEQIILPIRGQGLWGMMRGFLALEGDGNTIVGLSYYDHSETPGLGGEVDNPRWKAQWEGKQVYADNPMEPMIRLVKGGADSEYEADALSGATLTSRGVTNMLQFWLSEMGFAEYLARFHDNSQGGA